MRTLWLKSVDARFGPLLSRWMPAPRRTDLRQLDVTEILIIRPGGIGDAVLLIPAIRALRGQYPLARIHVLAETRNSGVFCLCGELASVRCYDRLADLAGVLAGRYDLVIDTEQWHHFSAVLVRLLRGVYTLGFATNLRQRLFTCSVAYEQARYEVDSFLSLLEPLGISRPDFGNRWLEIPQRVRETADNFLAGLARPFVVIFPGASIAERRWETSRFAELAGQLVAEGMDLVVLGGHVDRDAGAEIVRRGGLNLAGQTSLQETAAILQSAALLVSGDSGVLHLAVGLDTPTVSLFGPGRQQKWGPRGERHVVLNQNLPCSPCTTFGTTPACEKRGACLEAISVHDVMDAVRKVLDTVKRSGDDS